ncbi:hypothetical protein GCM10009806_21240 [Microbacterium flavum]
MPPQARLVRVMCSLSARSVGQAWPRSRPYPDMSESPTVVTRSLFAVFDVGFGVGTGAANVGAAPPAASAADPGSGAQPEMRRAVTAVPVIAAIAAMRGLGGRTVEPERGRGIGAPYARSARTAP